MLHDYVTIQPIIALLIVSIKIFNGPDEVAGQMPRHRHHSLLRQDCPLSQSWNDFLLYAVYLLDRIGLCPLLVVLIPRHSNKDACVIASGEHRRIRAEAHANFLEGILLTAAKGFYAFLGYPIPRILCEHLLQSSL